MLKLAALIMTCVVALLGCKSTSFTEQTRSPGASVRYFRSFASYELPFRPVGEISIAEMKELSIHHSYEEALYDNTGKLVKLNEHFAGKIVRQVKYFYDSNDQIIKCEMTHPSDPNSELIELYFNEAGELVKVKTFNNNRDLIKEETTSAGKRKKE
jgi:hypothetical protein